MSHNVCSLLTHFLSEPTSSCWCSPYMVRFLFLIVCTFLIFWEAANYLFFTLAERITDKRTHERTSSTISSQVQQRLKHQRSWLSDFSTTFNTFFWPFYTYIADNNVAESEWCGAFIFSAQETYFLFFGASVALLTFYAVKARTARTSLNI